MPAIFDEFARFLNLGRKSYRAMASHVERITGQPLEAYVVSPEFALWQPPTLLIHAPDDREVSADHARTYAAAGEHIELHWVEGLGHRRILADPGVAARAPYPSVRADRARSGCLTAALRRASCNDVAADVRQAWTQRKEDLMKTPDKQWSRQKDKDRNKAERDKLRKQSSQQQARDQDARSRASRDRKATRGASRRSNATAIMIPMATASDADRRVRRPDGSPPGRPVGRPVGQTSAESNSVRLFRNSLPAIHKSPSNTI